MKELSPKKKIEQEINLLVMQSLCNSIHIMQHQMNCEHKWKGNLSEGFTCTKCGFHTGVTLYSGATDEMENRIEDLLKS